MLKLLYRTTDAVRTFVIFAYVVTMIFLVGETFLKPIAPIITLLVITSLTIQTLAKWRTALLALTGLALFAAPWPVSDLGVWIAAATCSIGFTIWVVAIYMSMDT